MGKRRNTAKTGDKGLYKNRQQDEDSKPRKGADDDDMYNEVDRFHNEKDEEFLKLDQQPEDDVVEDDGYADKEAVMDLAGGSSSSSSDDDDDSDDDDQHGSESEQEAVSSDDDDDSDLEMDEEAVTDWGRRKSSYHGGDTADLEIGQDEDDAYLEEEAAKEVLAARYEQMDEDDFVLSDNEEDEQGTSKGKVVESVRSARDLKKMSRKAKRKLLQSHHPELLPLVSHFSEVVQDWNDRTRVVADALFSSEDVSPEDVGATNKGLEYLATKALIQSSTALNVVSYLLLKAEQAAREKSEGDMLLDGDVGSEIKSHPVMARLQQLNKLNVKLEDNVESKVPNIADQLDNLVKAASLMKDEAGNDSDEESEDDAEEESVNIETQQIAQEPKRSAAVAEMREEDGADQQELAQGVLNDARFGLRPKEVAAATKKSKKARQRRAAPTLDFGDEEKDEAQSRLASQSLASTINAIQQRSAAKSSKKSKRMDEDLDNQDDAEIRRGLAMMEEELGPLGSDDDDDDGEVDDELDDGLNDDGGFYDKIKKKSKARKDFKKSLYAVAPKYPGMEAEVEGERAINNVILKNRGLVPHKPKINRNPRVKKREQYRKAVIRRKGKVREVRTDEGHKYGGEGTGIKTGLSRSRKLVS